MWLSRFVGGGEKLDGAKDGTASKKIAPASKQCTEDMAAQGASSPGDIAFLELTLALARSVGEGELDGWQYKGPVQLAAGASKVKKWGIKTYDDVLDEANKSGDLTRVAGHISTVVEVLSQSDHPFASQAASRILNHYQKACRNFNNKPGPTLFYLRECRLLKMAWGARRLPPRVRAILRPGSNRGGVLNGVPVLALKSVQVRETFYSLDACGTNLVCPK